MPNPMMIQISLEIWGAVFCIICGLIVFKTRTGESKRSLTLMIGLFIEAVQLIFDSLALSYRGQLGLLAMHMVKICNYGVFLTNYLLCIIVAFHINELIKNPNQKQQKIWLGSVSAISTSGIIVLTLNPIFKFLYYFDATNTYHRASAFWINMLLPIIAVASTAIIIIINKSKIGKTDFLAILLYILFPMITTVVQMFIYGISLTNIVNTLTILLFFVVHETEKSKRIIEQEKIVAQQKIELSETKVNLMISRIQPHFISNTLLTLQGLYHKDINKADIIMDDFITYLQHSFNELSMNEPINVESELEHTRHYTSIAKARWEDITIKYDIESTDFCVPPITIQPLVENSVRHGIMPLESGGIITISTKQDEQNNYVIIEDNGVGFDINNPKPQYNDNRTHIGLSNITERLKIMCNAIVDIQSEIGKGTVVTITIPKEM